MNGRVVILGALLLIMLLSGIHIAAQVPQLGQQQADGPELNCRDTPPIPNNGGYHQIVGRTCDDVVWDGGGASHS